MDRESRFETKYITVGLNKVIICRNLRTLGLKYILNFDMNINLEPIHGNQELTGQKLKTLETITCFNSGVKLTFESSESWEKNRPVDLGLGLAVLLGRRGIDGLGRVLVKRRFWSLEFPRVSKWGYLTYFLFFKFLKFHIILQSHFRESHSSYPKIKTNQLYLIF